MRYRVVYVDHVARLSGGEIALTRLLPALQHAVDPHVILGEDGPLVERLQAAGISVEVLPIGVAARDLRKDRVRPGRLDPRALTSTAGYTWALVRRLRELKPDMVHTNSLKAALYGGVAGRLAGVPVLWHIRDRIAADYLPAAAVRLVRTAGRVLPSAVIANSRATLATLPGVGGVVVANVVVHDAVGQAHSRVDQTDGRFRIGVVGRLAPWKGQDLFLRAFADAFPEGDCEARLIGSAMFGEDVYGESLRSLAGELGIEDRVDFRGFQEDVWSELAELDVLVHCSLTPEPFGQVVVEGMAAGVPVIAAAAGGPAEIITDHVDGLLTEPGDAAELAAALRVLHDRPDLAAGLAARGLETAARYSPDRTAEQVIAVYEQVMNAGRSAGPGRRRLRRRPAPRPG